MNDLAIQGLIILSFVGLIITAALVIYLYVDQQR